MTEEIKYYKEKEYPLKWIPAEEMEETPQQTIDRLEQENKELKEEKQAIKSYLGIEAKTILERLEELDEWKHNDKLLLWNYRSALEEIRELAEKSLKISYNLEVNSMLYDIKHKINEVLGDEGN